MAKIYKIDSLRYTPFDENFIKEDFQYLQSKGLEIATSKKEADLFLVSDSKKLKKFLIRNPFKGPILLWTNEPRLSTVKSTIYRPYPILAKVNVMNVYSGDVFINNVTYQEKRFSKNKTLQPLPDNFILKNRMVAALMSYYNAGKHTALFVEGVNIDLVKKRSDIGIYGHQHKLLQIFGRGWPSGMVMEDSRLGDWGNRKTELLADYNFNLCFENTVCPKYITEKIWDSIESYCLPIYYGGLDSTIYELFPKDSFIDYAKFEEPSKLFDFIKNLSDSEFVSRMNKCIKVYNTYAAKPLTFWKENKRVLLDNIVSKCELILKN